MNEWNTSILRMLFKEKRPIPGKELAMRCDMAINTLRKEIDCINETMEKHGFHIASKLSAGYYVEIVDYEEAVPYMERLQYLMERNLRIGGRRSSRVSYLMRRCLCANEDLTVEGLCDELYCSRSTLLRDLNKVEQELKEFGLILKSRKGGYGFSVEGSEWDLRQCLIYQHKVYILSLEEMEKKEYAFKTLFFMMSDADDSFQSIRRELMDCLAGQQDFFLPILSYPKLIHYIQLCASRRKKGKQIRFTGEQVSRAESCAEYRLVCRLQERLPERFRDALGETDRLALTMLILSYETRNNRLPYREDYPAYYAETQEMIDYLVSKWGYEREIFDESFIKDWICFLYTMENRRIFHVFNDTESLGTVHNKGVWTTDFCISFGRFYEEKHGIHLSRQDVLSAYYLFYQALRNKKICYYARNILMISQYGVLFAKSFADYIRTCYGNEVGAITVKEYGEEWREEGIQYDMLMTDIGPDRVWYGRYGGLPVLPVNFRTRRTSCPELDTYFQELRQQNELAILTEDSFYYTSLNGKEAVFRYLAGVWAEEGVKEQNLIANLMENDAYIDLERDKGIVLLPILMEEVKRSRLVVLINDTDFVWNEERVRIFICYSRIPSPRENQILNEILDKFMHLSADQVQAILSPAEENPIMQLYPEL